MTPDTTVRRWPRHLHLWRAVALAWVAGVVWFSLVPHPPQLLQPFPGLDKLEHFAAYLLLMGCALQGWRRRHERWVLAIALVSLGALLELLQGLGGVRQFELLDLLANSLGVAVGLALGRTAVADLALRLERPPPLAAAATPRH